MDYTWYLIDHLLLLNWLHSKKYFFFLKSVSRIRTTTRTQKQLTNSYDAHNENKLLKNVYAFHSSRCLIYLLSAYKVYK